MGKFIAHEPCSHCGSSDAMARYGDGSGFCFSCEVSERPQAGFTVVALPPKVTRMETGGVLEGIRDRKISLETCVKFGVTVEPGKDGTPSAHYYPYHNSKTGEHTATKKRICSTKEFPWSGNRADIGLFGQQVCSGRGKFITITEGEADALAVSEMFDRKWDVVSLKDGAGNAKRDIQSQLEFLEGYDKVVLCFDSDKAGQEAIEKVKDLFSPNKLKIVHLPEKDAGEMLKQGKVQAFVKAWWDAKAYTPDGIVSLSETWDAILAYRHTPSVSYPFEGMTRMVKGIRQAEIVTITSGSGMGKSQLVREIENHLINTEGAKLGVLALEESVARTAMGLMSIEANRPLHLDDFVTDDELRALWERVVAKSGVEMLDHRGFKDLDTIKSRMRYMAKAMDCKFIVLDHLHIVCSTVKGGSEWSHIDELMTDLRGIAHECNIGLFIVSHVSRSGGTPYEEGGQLSLQSLRGSQGIAQLSDVVWGLERNQQEENEAAKNITLIRCLKNRWTGETGVACYLKYDTYTGRMTECPPPPKEGMPSEF